MKQISDEDIKVLDGVYCELQQWILGQIELTLCEISDYLWDVISKLEQQT